MRLALILYDYIPAFPTLRLNITVIITSIRLETYQPSHHKFASYSTSCERVKVTYWYNKTSRR